MKKLIPYLLLLVLFVIALFVKRCRENDNAPDSPSVTQEKRID